MKSKYKESNLEKIVGAIVIGLMILLIVLLLNSCSLTKKYPQDNFIEEYLEEVLRRESGLDLDISPFSPEEDKSLR